MSAMVMVFIPFEFDYRMSANNLRTEPTMTRKKQFTVTDGKLVLKLEPAEEGGYFVTAPFDPNVLTQAETVEEAFENAYDVIALFAGR
jgi:antitoxin HicB